MLFAFSLPRGRFSLRSLGAGGMAGPPTSRPGGPILELIRFCRYALCSMLYAVVRRCLNPEQLKGEGE